MSDSPLSDDEKATFKRATDRRREAGIRLKRFTVLMESSQVEAINILWDAWVERFGKTRAIDELIRIMAHVEARLRDKERAAGEKGRAGN